MFFRLCLLFSVLFCATPSYAIQDGTLTGAGYSEVGALITQDKDGNFRTFCTATLVCSNVVITAGHCLEGWFDWLRDGKASGLWFTNNPAAAILDTSSPYNSKPLSELPRFSVDITDILFSDSFEAINALTPSDKIALLKIEDKAKDYFQNITFPEMGTYGPSISKNKLEKRPQGSIIGYGLGGLDGFNSRGQPAPPGFRRRGRILVDDYFRGGWLGVAREVPNKQISCHGDSGGPLYPKETKRLEGVGAHAYYSLIGGLLTAVPYILGFDDSAFQCADQNSGGIYMSVAARADWIRSILAEWCVTCEIQLKHPSNDVCPNEWYETKLKGDFNNNSEIDLGDIAVIMSSVGLRWDDPHLNHSHDLNSDGVVDEFDVEFLGAALGTKACNDPVTLTIASNAFPAPVYFQDGSPGRHSRPAGVGTQIIDENHQIHAVDANGALLTSTTGTVRITLHENGNSIPMLLGGQYKVSTSWADTPYMDPFTTAVIYKYGRNRVKKVCGNQNSDGSVQDGPNVLHHLNTVGGK